LGSSFGKFCKSFVYRDGIGAPPKKQHIEFRHFLTKVGDEFKEYFDVSRLLAIIIYIHPYVFESDLDLKSLSASRELSEKPSKHLHLLATSWDW